MVSFKLVVLALTFLRALAAEIQLPEGITVEELEELPADASQQQTPNLAVAIKTSFPQSELFGVKLVNGHPTKAIFDVSNDEPEPITIHLATGSLWSLKDMPGAPQPPVALKNLTMQRFGVEIPAGESESLTYAFSTEMHPQDLNLALVMMLQGKGEIFTKVVYNETVSVVEAPTSFFDPQIIFLYLFLAAGFGGTCYFIYSTWITTLFPQKRRGGKGGERAKRSSGGAKKVDPADQVGVVGADGPATTTSSKAYDESWIPAEHLKRPEARRVGSGRPKSRAA